MPRSDLKRGLSFFQPLDTAGPAARRVHTFDFFKGFAMLLIYWVHAAGFWNDGSWVSVYRVGYIFVDWIGPSLFVSLSVIGTLTSIKQRVAAGKGGTKALVLDAFKKFSFMFAVGTIMNVSLELDKGSTNVAAMLMGMNMITAIAFVQLFAVVLYKLSRNVRIVVLLVLVALYYPLLGWCLGGLPVTPGGAVIIDASTATTAHGLLYFLLFDFDMMIPTFSWVVVSLMASIAFDGFTTFTATSLRGGRWSPEVFRSWQAFHARKLLVAGAMILLAVFLLGGFVLSPGISFSRGVFLGLTNGDAYSFWTLPGIPLFLARHVPHYLAYNFGLFTVVFSLFYTWLDVRGTRGRVVRTIEVFGVYSFSTFVYGYAFALIPVKFSFGTFWIFFVLVLGGLVVGVWAWNRWAGGILSLEWGMKTYMRALAVLEKQKKKRLC